MAKKAFVIFDLLLVLGFSVWWNWPDGNLHVVFCDVGQGDGIIVWKGFTQLIVDGGPDDRMLDCVGRHFPFYDRAIDMVIVTHPESDHMNGITHVLQRYSLKYLFMNPVEKDTTTFAALKQVISQRKIVPRARFTGSKIKFDGIEYSTVWPTRDWIDRHTVGRLSDGTNMNGFGIVGTLSYGNFDVLLTADVDIPFQPLQLATGQLRAVEVLKVPHHGSRTGMDPDWLDAIDPSVAVVSSGKNNSYGHPAPEALEMLNQRGIKILRTDEMGDVEIVSDGKRWWIKD